MVEEKKAFFAFDLGDNRHFSFESMDDIDRWVSKESDFWNWLREASVGELGNQMNDFQRDFVKRLNLVRNRLDEWKRQPDDPAHSQNFLNAIHSAYGGPVLLRNHPWARIAGYVAKKSGPTAGAAALGHLLKKPMSFSEAIEGIVSAKMARDGILPTSPTIVEKVIQDLTSDAAERLTQWSSQVERSVEAGAVALHNSIEASEKKFKDSSDRWSEFSTSSAQEISAALESIKNTEATFTKFMQLRASVSYWSDQSRAHQKSSIWFLAVLLVFAVAIGGVASFVGVSYLPILASKEIGAATSLYAITASLTLLVTTVVFWAARVLVRLYLSSRHLSVDARERVVMVQTYLALIKEGQLDEKERALVLTPLFRPSADGIVKDEGAPDLSLAALVARMLDKKN